MAMSKWRPVIFIMICINSLLLITYYTEYHKNSQSKILAQTTTDYLCLQTTQTTIDYMYTQYLVLQHTCDHP